jgi:hypothetical protein
MTPYTHVGRLPVLHVHLLVLCAVTGCTKNVAPDEPPAALPPANPAATAGAEALVGTGELSRPDPHPFPFRMDGIGGLASDGTVLHVYGVDLQTRAFKRVSVDPDGSMTVEQITESRIYQRPVLPTRCDPGYVVADYLLGSGNQWEVVSIDLLLAAGSSTPLATDDVEGFAIPELACDDSTMWAVWRTEHHTVVQRYANGTLVDSHALERSSDTRTEVSTAVARDGRLYLLLNGENGIAAVLFDREGEPTRTALASARTRSHSLVRVGERFFAAWLEETDRATPSQSFAGSLKGQWLDSSFVPSDAVETLAEATPSTETAVFLWSDGVDRLAVGRTDQRRIQAARRTEADAYRLESPEYASWVAGYDVVAGRIGTWHDAGPAPIFGGAWAGGTLSIVVKGLSYESGPGEPGVGRERAEQVVQFRVQDGDPATLPRP